MSIMTEVYPVVDEDGDDGNVKNTLWYEDEAVAIAIRRRLCCVC